MGSEWGFYIKSKRDVEEIMTLVYNHNNEKLEEVGEPLEVYSIIQYVENKKYYLCIGNEGGRELTTAFIMNHYKGGLVYYPFTKPPWWSVKSQYTVFWYAENSEQGMEPEKYMVTPWD